MGDEGFRHYKGSTSYSTESGFTEEATNNKLLRQYFPTLIDKVRSLEQRGISGQTIIDIDTSGVVKSVSNAMSDFMEHNEELAASQIAVGLGVLNRLELTHDEISQLNARDQQKYRLRQQSLEILRGIEQSFIAVVDAIDHQTKTLETAIHWLGDDIQASFNEQNRLITREGKKTRNIMIAIHHLAQQKRDRMIQVLEAIQIQQGAAQQTANESKINDILIQARVLIIEGDVQKAYEYLQLAYEFNPNYPPTAFSLISCLIKMGRISDARKYADWLIDIARTGQYTEYAHRLKTDEEFKLIR